MSVLLTRLMAADLAHHELDRAAFDAAVDEFDGACGRARRQARGSDQELHALEKFLRKYLMEAGRCPE